MNTAFDYLRPMLRWLVIASMVIAIAEVSAQTVPSTGLIGYWRGEGNLADSSTTANHGTSFGGTYATGVVGTAFSLTSGSYVSIPDLGAYNFAGNNFSLGFWFNQNGTSGLRVFLGQDYGGGGLNKWFVAYNYVGGALALHLNGTTSADIATGAVTVDSTSWYHLALVRSGSTMTFYLNGALIGSPAFAGTIPDPIAPLRLGFGETGGFDFSGGLLDEVVIYNRALLPAEVSSLAAVPEPVTFALHAGLAALTFIGLRRFLVRRLPTIVDSSPR